MLYAHAAGEVGVGGGVVLHAVLPCQARLRSVRAGRPARDRDVENALENGNVAEVMAILERKPGQRYAVCTIIIQGTNPVAETPESSCS